jgi:DNA repair protein RadC
MSEKLNDVNKKEENNHKGHRKKVRDRYLVEGLDSFKEHQVLELLLFYAIPQKDTNDLAHDMLNEYKTLAKLFDAEPLDIMERCGVSENTAILVSLLPSIAKYYLKAKRDEKKLLLNNPKAVGEYAVPMFTGMQYESFVIFCLNAQNKVLHEEVIQKGTLSEVPVYPRKIVELALLHKAHSIILAHNHPGGSLVPSQDDINITKTIISALDVLEIKVRDHIIVAGEEYLSLKQENYF